MSYSLRQRRVWNVVIASVIFIVDAAHTVGTRNHFSSVVTFLAPARAPLVADNHVLNAILHAEPNSLHRMIEPPSALCGRIHVNAA
jgi:hypothetical protein